MDSEASTDGTSSLSNSSPPSKLEPFTLPPTGSAAPFVLPSIHSWPPFYTQQRNPTVIAKQTQLWTRLILSFAQHRRLFVLRLQDAEQRTGNDWVDIFWNPRIKRILKKRHLQDLMCSMVAAGDAAYEPEKQTSSVLVYWRRPEQWAETIYDWVVNTGQLNTILTFYEISEPEIQTEMSALPFPLLRKALALLIKSGKAQIIEGGSGDGSGVRFFAR